MHTNEIKLLSFHELKGMVGLSRPTVWRMVRVGKFPAPIEISKGRRAWDVNDVHAWLASRKLQAA